MSGTLFVVGTPIGNLEDLTFRALRTLKDVDVIAAEDTRRTAKLLAHYEIRKPLVSVREHNERRETPRILERLKRGESVALVTDAGTPGIADPGARLVAAVREAGLRVVPIPGASAVATALSVSGFAADEFTFMGFPPRSGKEREDWFRRLKADPRVIVFFEAPHRIERTLSTLRETDVIRPIIVMRELSKIHEQLVLLPLLLADWQPDSRVFFTVVVVQTTQITIQSTKAVDVADLFGRLTELAGLPDNIALGIMEMTFHIPQSAVRKAVKRHRISVKQQNDQRQRDAPP
jgi:16S rRNA (cytidine1402-2'-O)-methyltransferase